MSDTKRVLGKYLKVGDVLRTFSGDHTITAFSPHPGLYGHIARIAESGVWAMTVFNSDHYDVVVKEVKPNAASGDQ